MRLRSLLILLGLLCPASLWAQSPMTLRWTQAAPLADVQGYTYTLRVDALPAVSLMPACVAGTPVSCSAPFTMTPNVAHTLILTATNAFGSASSLPLVGIPPIAPGNLSVVITLTIP